VAADAAQYAGALFVPLLLVGALLALVLTGLAPTLDHGSRLVRLAFVATGAMLLLSSAWLVVYATGPDTYYGPTEVSRWEHAQRFTGAWPIVAAVALAVAVGLGLIATAGWPKWANWRPVVSLLSGISCLFLLYGWFALTAGH
jgi:H+/Cl- antiporter ClcA